MKFSVSRESLLEPLQAVIGVVGRRQTMPILGNVMLVASDKTLSLTATDLEVELHASAEIDGIEVPGDITIPGRKLIDIVRAIPDGASLNIKLDGDRLTVQSGRSRFVLSTLPVTEFPVVDDVETTHEFEISQQDLAYLLDKTHFSMAQQDVRYYLNGLLLEIGNGNLRAVATDGHRLAMCQVAVPSADVAPHQVIVPRKGVLELQRLLGGEGDLKISLSNNHLKAEVGSILFTSKLIDGRFPDYERVIPAVGDGRLTASRGTLREALQRAAILSNEKYRGVRLDIQGDRLHIQANNPEQEEAEDEIEVNYAGDNLEIGFNVNYLLDALAAVDSEDVEIGFVDSNSSCLIHAPGAQDARFVVMPMRL
jgi:DNA polymerase-3 subunit beta